VTDFRHDVLNFAGSLIAIGLVAILGFLSWALVYVTVPAENESALNLVIGILSAQVGIVVGFFFGTSFANKRQTETIDKLADTTKAAQTAALPSSPPAVTLAPGEQATVAAAEDPGREPGR